MNGSVVRIQQSIDYRRRYQSNVVVGINVGSTKCHCRVLHRHTFTDSAQLPAQIQHSYPQTTFHIVRYTELSTGY
jgi:hypothetical protein